MNDSMNTFNADAGLGEQGPTPEQTNAANALAGLRANPQFAQQLASGDRTALETYRAHQRVLHSPIAPQGAAPSAGLAANAQQTQSNQSNKLGADISDQSIVDQNSLSNEMVAGAFEGPSDPARYAFDYYGVENVDRVLDGEFRSLAVEMRLPQHVAREMFEGWNALAKNPPTPEQIHEQMPRSAAALNKAWGAEFEANIAAARSVIDALPADKKARAIELLEISGLGNDVNLIKRLANIGNARGYRKGR